MFKPIKKTFLLVAGIAVLALSLVACGGGNNPEEGGLVEKEITQAAFDDYDSSKIISGYAYITYPLNEFAGKKVTIDFSCDMKVVNTGSTTANIQWQVNDGSTYPTVASKEFAPTDTDWVTVAGKIEGVEIKSGYVLYLSTYLLETDNLTISAKNIKYKVTYGASKDAPKAKTYPTDIFTVGEAGSCGITLGDAAKEAFTIFEQSAASSVETGADGSVSWIATAAGGGGGGVSFYAKSSKEEIQLANYESIEIELVYSPVTGKWNPEANKPGFCMRILPYDSTGIFGGFEDLEYFDAPDEYGTLKKTISITDAFVAKIVESADFDAIKGFAIKFNDYNRGNDNGDQLKVQLKSVKFNKKANAVADHAWTDGLTDAQRGTVKSIEYSTKDYAEYNKKQAAIADAQKALADAKTDEEKAAAQTKLDEANAIELSDNWTKGYKKHAWVYLPAGYDPADTTTKYPVFVLLHGFYQNENTWGLSDKGTGGKIKGYMDRGMAAEGKDQVKKFILVCATGVADKTWGPDGAGSSMDGFNAFGGELRNDLLPYIWENYNASDNRDDVAIAGLSMGGGQTFTIGIGECLDLISNFAGFSGALFAGADDFTAGVEAKFDKNLKIHNLYMICGDADSMVYGSFPGYVDAMAKWDRVENFESYVFPGGTHDFPVWYRGFKDFIQIVFKEGVQLY